MVSSACDGFTETLYLSVNGFRAAELPYSGMSVRPQCPAAALTRSGKDLLDTLMGHAEDPACIPLGQAEIDDKSPRGLVRRFTLLDLGILSSSVRGGNRGDQRRHVIGQLRLDANRDALGFDIQHEGDGFASF